MASKRILVVGGVAGGASCAARARRNSEAADIVVIERGPYASFANCGLPVSACIARLHRLLLDRVAVRNHCTCELAAPAVTVPGERALRHVALHGRCPLVIGTLYRSSWTAAWQAHRIRLIDGMR